MKRQLFTLKNLLLAALCLLAVSCAKDGISPNMSDSDEVSVHFRIRTPRPTQVATRTETDENNINNVTLLVFCEGETEGEYLYQYAAAGRNIDPADAGTDEVDFEAVLRVSEDPVKLLVIANSPVGPINEIAEGTTEAEVRAALTGDDIASVGENGFPMTGVKTLSSISQATGSLQIPMIRSNAKISIAEATTNFVINSVTVYRANDSWQYFPNAETMEYEDGQGGTPRATFPSLPADVAAIDEQIMDIVESGAVSDFYINESEDNPEVDQATCIVVGGYFNGSGTETFYRLDIGGTDASENYYPFGQVLRNYWYQFTIVKVTAKGWRTPRDAARNPATGLVATVMPWNGGDNSEYHFGSNRYVILSKSGLMLDPVAADEDALYITTSEVPFSLFSENEPSAGPIDTSDPGSMTMETALFTYTLTSFAGAEPGRQRWLLTVTTKTADVIGDYLNLTAPGSERDIRIPIRRDAEFSVERIGELESVPNTGTLDKATDDYTYYVEYQVNIPDGMTWNAEITEQSWVSGNTSIAVHPGYLLDADGQPAGTSLTGQANTTTLRVGFDQLYYPTLKESPQVTIEVDLDGVVGMTQIITVVQDPLPVVTGSLDILDLRNTGYGSLTSGSALARWSQYIKAPTVFGISGRFQTIVPIVLTGLSSSASADPASIDPKFRYLHLGGEPQTYSQARHNAVNAYWKKYGNDRIFVYDADRNNNYIFANAAVNGNKRTTVLSELGIQYVATTTGTKIKAITTEAAIQSTAIFQYLTQDGPFGATSDFANFTYYIDGISTAVTRSSLPSTAIPIMFDGGGVAGGRVVMFIDPTNGIVYLGDSQMFDGGTPAYSSVAVMAAGNADTHSKFLANLLAYIVNCAQYGSGFADLFIPGNEALYEAAFPTPPAR